MHSAAVQRHKVHDLRVVERFLLLGDVFRRVAAALATHAPEHEHEEQQQHEERDDGAQRDVVGRWLLTACGTPEGGERSAMTQS